MQRRFALRALNLGRPRPLRETRQRCTEAHITASPRPTRLQKVGGHISGAESRDTMMAEVVCWSRGRHRRASHSVAHTAMLVNRPRCRSSSSSNSSTTMSNSSMRYHRSSHSYRWLLFFCYLAAQLSCTTAAQPNCSEACLAEIAQIRLEDIKNRLLSSMGMQEPPKVDSVDLPPSAIEEMIEGLEEMDEKLEEDTAEKTFIIAVDPSEGLDRQTLVANFPVSMTTMMRKVAKAYLHVYLDVDQPLSEPEPVEVIVRERRLNGELGDIVATKTVVIEKSDKIVVPLKSSDVERWWRSEPVLGLYVVAMLDGQNIAVHPQENRHARHTMFMSVTLDSSSSARRKRSPSVCTPEDQEPGCCLYDLTVDFQQMGWKFIIAPHKYNAYMCRGDCSLSHPHVSRAGHTKVAKTGVITRQDATGTQGMCCHPAEYDAIRLIYMNADNQVTMARVPGMIARKCSCS